MTQDSDADVKEAEDSRVLTVLDSSYPDAEQADIELRQRELRS